MFQTQDRYYEPKELLTYEEQLNDRIHQTLQLHRLPPEGVATKLSFDAKEGIYTARFKVFTPIVPDYVRDLEDPEEEKSSPEDSRTFICRDLKRMDATRLHNRLNDTPGFRLDEYSEEKGVVAYTAPSLHVLLKGMNNYLDPTCPIETQAPNWHTYKGPAVPSQTAKRSFLALEGKREHYPSSLLKNCGETLQDALTMELGQSGQRLNKNDLHVTFTQKAGRCKATLEASPEIINRLSTIPKKSSEAPSFRLDHQRDTQLVYSAKSISQLLEGFNTGMQHHQIDIDGLVLTDTARQMSI